ncbi:MAG: GNAT family N-acetyltransferase [Jatrophihabitantaceae bacterium]
MAYTVDFTEERRGAGTGETIQRTTSLIGGRALEAFSRREEADVVVVGTSAAAAWRLPRTASLVIPMRVHFVLDFDRSVDALLQNASKRGRREFRRKSNQHVWEHGITRDPSWFDVFYDRFYQPTMVQRHGPHARTENRESAYECLFRSGMLFYLSMDGERVAGKLCHWNPSSRILTSRLLGVLDGSAEYYRADAVKIIFYSLIEWAGRNGIRRLDFQGTEPFLSKGTYQMKRRFGTRVILPPNHFGRKRLWFQIRRDTPAVRDFLVGNPVLTESVDGSLCATYFYDGQRPPRTDYQGESPGIDAVRQIDLDDFLAGCGQR